MPGIDPDEQQERIDYYQSREQVGPYLDKLYSFFPGQPTIPNNATANKAIYINNGRGPGAKILNGIKPFVPDPLPCEEIFITDLQVVFVDPVLTVNVQWTPLTGGIVFTLFNTSSGQVLVPFAVAPIPGGLAIDFDMTSPPATAGLWSFKITRAENLDCFAVRNDIFQLLGAVCLIDAGAWTLPGGAPFPGAFFGVGPPISVEITGSGFLSCPIGVSVDLAGGAGPLTQAVTSLVVVDDTTITFDVGRVGIGGFSGYEATVFCTDDPPCSDVADNLLFYVVF